jgi:hypothetical protein
MRAIQAFLAAAAVALALGPEAEAAPYKRVETWGWTAEVPANLEVAAREKQDPQNPHLGRWILRSPQKNVRIRVKIKHDKGEPLSRLAQRSFAKLVKRIPEIRVLKTRSFTAGGRDYFYVIADATMVRKERKHHYLLFRMMVRARNRKLRAHITIAFSDEKVDAFLAAVEKFIDTFNLVEPSSVALAVKKLRPTAPRPPAPTEKNRRAP